VAASLAIAANITVLAFDIPGTGESDEPLDEFADEIFLALISAARQIGNGKVAHFGLSFGGNFSAMSGLTGQVDAAVNLGGPIATAFTPGNFRNLMFGMAGIAGNAFGFDNPPEEPEMVAAAQPFVRQQLFDRRENRSMLVINGADDVHVPQSDTTVFEGRPDTEVHLLPGSGHCATSRLAEVLGIITKWLAQTLAER
jgi:esterase FrsA